MSNFKEKLLARTFLLIAFSTLTVLALIGIFIFVEGVPIIAKVGLGNFIFGMRWAPTQGVYGIFPMIVGSISVTLGAAILGVPTALCCAIFLTEFAPPIVAKVVRPAIQMLAGIPSVVYGFWGLNFIVPFIRNYFGGPGLSILAGSVILAIMILPTIISITEVAILSLPRLYKEGSFALGASHWQTCPALSRPSMR
jgi:phosphate transport system permease protein